MISFRAFTLKTGSWRKLLAALARLLNSKTKGLSEIWGKIAAWSCSRGIAGASRILESSQDHEFSKKH
jgi:hypothetical protein